MPIKIPDSLPATAVLESENIFVMTEYRAMHQDIRPLNVLILNLMPTKVITENQLLRKLSNTPLQIKVEFLQTGQLYPQHVDTEHMESFYTTFEQVKDRWFDGLIITGAPLALYRMRKYITGKNFARLWNGQRRMYTLQCTSAGEHWLDSITFRYSDCGISGKTFRCVFQYRIEEEFPVVP